RSMADDSHGLLSLEEILDEAHHLGDGAQRIGIGDAARQHQRHILLRLRLVEGAIDAHFLAFLVMLHTLDVAILWRHDLDLRSLRFERLAWLEQFRLLEAISRHDSDALALQCLCHAKTLLACLLGLRSPGLWHGSAVTALETHGCAAKYRRHPHRYL